MLSVIDESLASISAAQSAAPTTLVRFMHVIGGFVQLHLPVLVKVKKMEARGTISRRVATRPNLKRYISILSKGRLCRSTQRDSYEV